MKKGIFVIVVSFLLLAFFVCKKADFFVFKPEIAQNSKVQGENKEVQGAEIAKTDIQGNIVIEEKDLEFAKEEKAKEEEIKKEVLLKLSFISQAPMQKWDALHEDACEEASLMMVKDFLKDGTAGKIADQEKEIQNLVRYETKNGYGLSITLSELNKIAADHYGLKTGRVEKNITVKDIKKELLAGRPVIVGAAGKVLPNPNFKNGGPNYHMLVIKGYDSKGFVTNDPGTRKGENFRYTFEDMFKSIHDWNEKNILNGGKDYLVFD